MSKKKVFTDQELKQMGRRTLDEVVEAIDAGIRQRPGTWPSGCTGVQRPSRRLHVLG